MTTDEQLITLLETIQETGSISRSAASTFSPTSRQLPQQPQAPSR